MIGKYTLNGEGVERRQALIYILGESKLVKHFYRHLAVSTKIKYKCLLI